MGIQINGNTDTISAIDGGLTVSGADLGSASASSLNISGIVTASGFSGNVNATGLSTFSSGIIGNVTGNINSTGVSTITTLSATTITGVSTIGVTTITATTLTVNGNAYPSAGPLSNRNLVVNGAMQVWQRGDTTTSVTGNSYYSADRFRNVTISAGTWTLSKSTTVPIGQGFAASLKYDCTTANASLSAGSLLMLEHRFEGQDMQSLKKGTASAESLTLSFWVRSNKTGTYIAELRDEDNNRTISQSYTIDASDTWEKKILTFAGDTTGALDNDNALSFYASFYLAAGTDYSSGTLSTSCGTRTNVNRAVGQVNLADSTSNEWYITGVQLEVGTVATPFEYRSYGEELALCQRYFHRMNTGRFVSGYKRHDAQCAWFYKSPVPMRVTPTPTLNTGGTFSNFQTNYSTTQTVPLVYDYSTITGNGVFKVNSTWSSTHTFIPAYEGFDISFSAEL